MMRRQRHLWVMLFIAVLIVGSISSSLAQTPSESILLTDLRNAYPLGLQMYLFEDPTGQLTITDITSPEYAGRFVLSSAENPNFGYTDSAYWVRFNLKNRTTNTSEWRLEVKAPFLDNVRLYQMTGTGRFVSQEMSDQKPFVERKIAHRNFIFRLQLTPNRNSTYYLRVENSGSLSIPLTLWSVDAFASNSYREQLIFGAFYGALVVIIGYSIFALVVLRQLKYFHHILLIVFYAIYRGTLDGLAAQYIWPELGLWNHFALQFFLLLMYAAILGFIRAFVNTSEFTPRLDILFQGLILLFLAMSLGVFILPYRLIAIITVVSVLSIVLLVTGTVFWVSYKHHYRPAIILTAAMLFFTPVALTISLATLGLIERNFVTANAGRILAVWLMAFVGVDFIQQLTTQVEERTQQLKSLNEQLQSELESAQQIQQSLLPVPNPQWQGIELLCYTAPAREVGGDFYTYHRFSKNRFAIAVGDVSGKGLSAALLMATSLAHFKDLLDENLAPAELLAQLDRTLIPYTQSTGNNCALCYVEFKRLKTGLIEVEVANAGGVPPYIRRQNGTVIWADAIGMPLGFGLGAETGYQSVTYQLGAGDMLILTSDGVAEAHIPGQPLFGFDRLYETIQRGPIDDTTAMLNHLQSELTAYVARAELPDDMTILVVQMSAEL